MPRTHTFAFLAFQFGFAALFGETSLSAVESGALKLENVVVTASPFRRSQTELVQATSVLAGRDLTMKAAGTLGDALADEVGMAATAFGPGASRPIIRGLGGDRVRVLENGIGTMDASVASPDHAVSIEPFLAERIEVVRGPASLLYGGAAVGGVVNVITHRIHSEAPRRKGASRFGIVAGGAGDAWTRGGATDVLLAGAPNWKVVLHLDGARREADNLRIPGWAESDALRAAETAEMTGDGDHEHEEARGRLMNSWVNTEGAGAGVSLVGRRGSTGVSYSGYNAQYGVPGHGHEHSEEVETLGAGGTAHAHSHEGHSEENEADGVHVVLRQRRVEWQGEWRPVSGAIKSLQAKIGRTTYRHAEIEEEVVGTLFENRGMEARFEAVHAHGDQWDGAFGCQLSGNTFSAQGAEAFLPASRTRSLALFAFEEWSVGRVTWQAGARWENQDVRVDSLSSERRDSVASGSLGAVYACSPTYAIVIALSQTGRAPSAQELYARGPHAGTASYEIGQATLGRERSRGIELSLRRKRGAVTGEATVFLNHFDRFIFERPVPEVAVEREGTLQPIPRTELLSGETGMPVYRYVDSEARFVGAEVEVWWHLHKEAAHAFDLKCAADVVRGRELDRPAGKDLPRMPAPRFILGGVWSAGVWRFGSDCQFVMRQNRTAPEENATADYTMLGFHVSRSLQAGSMEGNLFMKVTNLLNEEARPHTSFLKERAPLGARAFSIGFDASF